MKRINVTGTGERRVRVSSEGQSEISPAFMMEALSARFIPDLSESKPMRELGEPIVDMSKLIPKAPAAE